MTDASVVDRRGYAAAIGLLLVGAVLVLVAYGRTWSTTTVGGSGLPTITVTLSGNDLLGGVAVAVLALAGVAGLLAARRIGRVVIGVLLVAAGLVLAWTAVDFGRHWADRSGVGATLLDLVAEKAGVDAGAAVTTITPWWVVAAAAGLLVAAGGLLAVLRSRSWPEMGRRYERREEADVPARGTRPRSAWDQLDDGVDPTDEPHEPGPDDTTGDPTLRGGRDS